METNPQYKVIVSDRVKQMLATHIEFIARVDATAARKTKQAILDAMRSLQTMPERHPYFSAEFIPPNKYHRMVIVKRYLLLYQIKEQVVYADYLLDCRQDYSWL